MRTPSNVLILAVALALAPAASVPAAAAQPVAATARDGHTDFNFLFGHWRTHYMRLRHALRHDHEWYPCEGTSTITPFWKGSGNLEDGDLRCSHQYIEGMTLRLYDAKTHQWSLYWGNKRVGLTLPAQVGHFDERGVGDFFANDTWEGKPIIVRYRWALRSSDHPRFEQAFSADKGRTWETNWTTDYTRIP